MTGPTFHVFQDWPAHIGPYDSYHIKFEIRSGLHNDNGNGVLHEKVCDLVAAVSALVEQFKNADPPNERTPS